MIKNTSIIQDSYVRDQVQSFWVSAKNKRKSKYFLFLRNQRIYCIIKDTSII